MTDKNVKLGTLAAIREQFQKQKAPGCEKRCLHCGHALTIEKTKFFETEACENCFEHWQVNEVEDQCCDFPEYQQVKYVISGGGIHVREQCVHCGCLKANAIGGLSQKEKDALPLADLRLKETCYDTKWELKRQASIKFHDLKATQRKTNWMAEYSRYLNSPEWRQKRELVLRRDNHTCQSCLSAVATQVHHRSYEFVDLAGNEPAFDLVAVCTPCHEKIEEMKKNRRNQ